MKELSKELKTFNLFLAHFDPKQEIVVASDVSDYGINAVILHRLEDCTTKPVAHTSRTLLSVEKNYSQTEKEGFVIIFAVKIFIDLCMEGNLFCKWIIVHCCQFFYPKKVSLHIQLVGCNVREPVYEMEFLPSKKLGRADSFQN